MRKLAMALSLLPSLMVSQAPAKVDMTGKWSFSVTTDNGTGTPTLTFKQTSDSLTGHYSSQVFGEVDFKGTSRDGKLNFGFTISAQGQSIVVTYSGTIESNDAVKGTVDLGGFGTGSFTGTRQKPAGDGRGEVSAALASMFVGEGGTVRLGSPTPEAFLYVNDRLVGPIGSFQNFNVPSGQVRLTIRSAKCKQPWDSTITVAPRSTITIGRRLTRECQ